MSEPSGGLRPSHTLGRGLSVPGQVLKASSCFVTPEVCTPAPQPEMKLLLLACPPCRQLPPWGQPADTAGKHPADQVAGGTLSWSLRSGPWVLGHSGRVLLSESDQGGLTDLPSPGLSFRDQTPTSLT